MSKKKKTSKIDDLTFGEVTEWARKRGVCMLIKPMGVEPLIMALTEESAKAGKG